MKWPMSLSSRIRSVRTLYLNGVLHAAARFNSSVLAARCSQAIRVAYVGLAVLSIAVIVGDGLISSVEAKKPPKPTPVVIQSGSLNIPKSYVGVPLSFQIVVTGGTPPYTCTPDPTNNLAQFGMVLDKTCVLHGTPTKAGTVTF